MIDLLKIKPVRSLFLSRSFPIFIQIFFLLCFALLIYGGIVVPDVDKNLVKTLRNTNFATLLVWSLWWPLIILSAIIFGRIWCQVCPMELVNSVASKIGLKRKVPLFFKSGWIISLFYTLILLLIIHTFWAHRFPRRMALYLLLLFALTIIFGLIFEKRAFCNYVCPVGHLLGLYSLCSLFEWGVKDQNVCSQCKTKDCMDPKNYYILTKRSCTSNLYPAAIKDNRRCLLCTQCLKVCPYGNLRFSLRKPMADFFKSLTINSAEFFFIFVVSGFIIHEIYVEWAAAKKILLFIPDEINKFFGITGEPAYFISAVILFIFFPAVIFFVPSVLAKISARMSMFDAAKKFSIIILPVMAAAHILKSLFKITSRIPYYEFTIKDPLGITSANMITSGSLQLDKSFINLIFPFLSFFALILLLGSLLFSSVLIFKNSSHKTISLSGKISLLLGLLLYGSIFLVMVIAWRF